MHKDEVAEVPAGLTCLGSSPRCPVQGLYKRGSVFSLQAHPEFDEFIMSEIMAARHAQSIFDDALYADGMARAPRPHNGVAVAVKIWDFFTGN